MNIEENNFRDPVFDAGDLLGYVHIGENHRGYLGQGHVNFPELFKALVDADYDGVITFESFSSKVVDDNLTTTSASGVTCGTTAWTSRSRPAASWARRWRRPARASHRGVSAPATAVAAPTPGTWPWRAPRRRGVRLRA